MSSSRFEELHHAEADEAARAVLATTDLTSDELRAALANALSRIAVLEKEWNDLGQAFAWFNEHMRSNLPQRD